MFKQLNTTSSRNAFYLVGLSLVLGFAYFVKQQIGHSTISKRSDSFYQLLNNDKQYTEVLLKNEDIYSEMTKLYLSLKNAPEFSHLFSHYFHTYFHRGMCNFPTFFLAQALSVKLLSEGHSVSDVDLSFLGRAKSPWTKAIKWIKLVSNEEDNGGPYTNLVCTKSPDAINSLIKSEYRCTNSRR